MLAKGEKVIIMMLDGFGLDYLYGSEMPYLESITKDSFFKEGSAIFPTLTNANNISIVCGGFPELHGVTTNCFLNETTGEPQFLEDPSFLKSPTLFEQAAKLGMKSALVTSKSKTLRILGEFVSEGVAAQDPDQAMIDRFGTPPPIYSIEVNEWIFDAGISILSEQPEIDILYIHTTDYPMHAWAPDDPRSLDHLHRIDSKIGKIMELWPEAKLLITADHGMNHKTVCLDLEKILTEANIPVRAAISPVADRLVKHHGGYGGVSYIYLNKTDSVAAVLEFLTQLEGVEAVYSKTEAAELFHLDVDRIGDIVVCADKTTVFGTIDSPREKLSAEYRNHGSLHESAIPLIAHNVKFKEPDSIRYNFDLTREVFFNGEQ